MKNAMSYRPQKLRDENILLWCTEIKTINNLQLKKNDIKLEKALLNSLNSTIVNIFAL